MLIQIKTWAGTCLLVVDVMDMVICIIQIVVADLGAFGVIFILFNIRVSEVAHNTS